jgi:hypothetical protein
MREVLTLHMLHGLALQRDAALAQVDAPVQRPLHDTLRGDIDNSKPQAAAQE